MIPTRVGSTGPSLRQPSSRRLRAITRAITPLLLAGTVHAQPVQSVRLRLAHDTVLAGVSCAATGHASAVLHANGRLDECPVLRDTVMAGNALPAGTWIRLTEAGVLDGAWLPRDVELHGVPCKGTGYKDWSVRFHPNGMLASCYPSRRVVIEGVPCVDAWFWRELTGQTSIALHTNGRLRSCRLSRAADVDGVSYRKGARVERPGAP